MISMHSGKSVAIGLCYDMVPEIRQTITNQGWLESIDALFHHQGKKLMADIFQSYTRVIFRKNIDINKYSYVWKLH